MESFVQPIQLRWSDMDSNFHVRHSVYYDWGAMCRILFLEQFGLTSETMQQYGFGPILFREECVFRREVRMNDKIEIDLHILRARKDFSRWSIRHNILKGDVVAAVLTLDGAWLNIALRKLAEPPQIVKDVFGKMPRDAEFEWM